MERNFQSGKSINTKMKKRNKKKNSCAITRLWASVEAMSKDLFIDLDKQEITRLSTGNKLKFCLIGHKENNQLYYGISFKKSCLRVHRLFFYWKYGYLPDLVDHKDRNKLNNNIENLRELSDSENKRNSNKKKIECTSKYKGVSWSKRQRKWEARLKVSGKHLFLGYFNNEDDAGQAHNNAVRKYGLEEVSVMNDTPQERARKNIQFDPLPSEMNHLKDLFKNLEPLVDFK
jgi:hypothetical protein